jgi:uncharacterized membrane protein YphA (DoxX/SURF4 family)
MNAAAIEVAVRLMLGGLWVAAAAAKLGNSRQFREVVQEYALLVGGPAKLLGALLPLLELLLGLMLLAGVQTRAAAAGTAVLLIAFAGAMAHAIRHGRRIRCHCFGEFGAAMVSWTAVARNLILAVFACYVVLTDSPHWSLERYWRQTGGVTTQLSLLEVVPVWITLFSGLAALQLAYTIHRIQRVSRGRHPDTTMRL